MLVHKDRSREWGTLTCRAANGGQAAITLLDNDRTGPEEACELVFASRNGWRAAVRLTPAEAAGLLRFLAFTLGGTDDPSVFAWLQEAGGPEAEGCNG